MPRLETARGRASHIADATATAASPTRSSSTRLYATTRVKLAAIENVIMIDTPATLNFDHLDFLETLNATITDREVAVMSRSTDSLINLFARCELVVGKSSCAHYFSEDILRAIFLAGFDWAASDTQDGQMEYMQRMQFSIRVASVCRLWRDVAHAASLLWSTIYICLDRDLPLCPLDSFLSVSGHQVLCIAISEKSCGKQGAIEHIRISDAMQALVKHIDRWSTLNIAVQHYKTAVAILAVLKDHRPALKELSFHWAPAGGRNGNGGGAGLIPFPCMPSLHSLSVGLPLLPQKHGYACCFPSLTSLTVASPLSSGASFGQFFRSLQPMRYLRTIALHGPICAQFPLEHDHVCLERLEHLTLKDIPITQVYACLSALKVPRLAVLSVSVTPSHIITLGPRAIFPLIMHPDCCPGLQTLQLSPHMGHNLWDVERLSLGINSLKLINCKHRIRAFVKAASICRSEQPCFMDMVALQIVYGPGVPVKRLADLVRLLRELVETRRAAFIDERFGPGALSRLEEIHVRTFAPLEREEHEWFEANLCKFSWTLLSTSMPPPADFIEFIRVPYLDL